MIVAATVVIGLGLVMLPALFGRGVLLDVDLLSARLPFRALMGPAYLDAITCRQDTIDALPAIAEIRHALPRGELPPTWSPWEVGGAPLAGLPNVGFLSPLAWPYFVLPLWLAPAFVKLSEIVVAIAGTIGFLRRRGVSWASGWLAGFVFVTSGFMIMWSNWPQTRVAALIPALFWAVDRVVDLHRARDVVVLALVFAAMLLGGFPAVTVFAVMLAGAYALVRVWLLYRRRLGDLVGVLVAAVGGLFLGFGIAAVHMLPFLASLSDTLSERSQGGRHLPLSTALSLIAPEVRGNCRGGDWFGDKIPIEAVGYVGSGAVVLAVFALGFRRRRDEEPGTRTWLVASLVVIASMIWLGGPLLMAFSHLPVVGNNSIARAQSVVGFVLACLVALGFDHLTRRSPISAETEAAAERQDGLRPRSMRPVVVLLAATVALIVVVAAAVVDAYQDDYLSRLSGSLVLPLLMLAASVGLLVMVYVGPRAVATWAPIALVLVIVVQGCLFAKTMLPLNQRDLFFPSTTTHEFLQAHVGQDRYGAGDGTVDAALADWYHLRTPTGHQFTAPRWRDLLIAVDPDVRRSVTYSRFSPSLPIERVADSPILDRLAVRYWTANPRRAVGSVEKVGRTGRVALREGDNASCMVEAGPLRGINLYLTDEMPAAPPLTVPQLHVEVSAGGQTRTGSVLLDGTGRGPGRITVAVAGEDLGAGGRAQARVWLTGTDTARFFAGKGREVSCSRVVPDEETDRLRLVSTDAGSAIYERLDAMPRVRWASNSRVVRPNEQVSELQAGLPPDTVLLDDDSAPSAAGGRGSASVVVDEDSRIVIDTSATRRGFVVLADSIARPGWTARLDGQLVPILPADHALAAVAVPAGRHHIELGYAVPGIRAGLLVTISASVVAVAVVSVPVVLDHRRRRRGASAPSQIRMR